MSGTTQCDSILLFFCPTECERFILPHKDSFNVVFFYLKADEDSMKIICVLFVPKLRFRHSYHFEKLQHFLIDSNFFKAVTHKQRIFILNDKHEQKKLIINSMRDVDYCDSNYWNKRRWQHRFQRVFISH